MHHFGVKLLYFIRFTQSLMYIKQRHDNVVETMAQVKIILAQLRYHFLNFFNYPLMCVANGARPLEKK